MLVSPFYVPVFFVIIGGLVLILKFLHLLNIQLPLIADIDPPPFWVGIAIGILMMGIYIFVSGRYFITR